MLCLHPGGFLGAWWIQRKPVIHTLVNIQARWRSDLRKGCVLQRLPALIRIHQITLSFSLLFVYLQNTTSSFCYSSFCCLPLILILFVALFLSASFSLCLCLLDMLKFQSWGVTRELPCCSKIPPSHPLAKKKRQTHNHTVGWERRKDEHKQVRGEGMFSLCSDGAEVNRSKIDRDSDEEDRWSHGEGSMSRNRQRPRGREMLKATLSCW